LYSKKGKSSLISFAMGDFGRISRILCLYLGSPYTYVSLGKAVAPGQFSVDEVNKIINLKNK
jgi:3-dehydroquinate dehydratase-1